MLFPKAESKEVDMGARDVDAAATRSSAVRQGGRSDVEGDVTSEGTAMSPSRAAGSVRSPGAYA
jgi:hypothetical protein